MKKAMFDQWERKFDAAAEILDARIKKENQFRDLQAEAAHRFLRNEHGGAQDTISVAARAIVRRRLRLIHAFARETGCCYKTAYRVLCCRSEINEGIVERLEGWKLAHG